MNRKDWSLAAWMRPAAVVGFAVFTSGVLPPAARAVMDIDDRGPTLRVGGFRARVTNVGIIGNAFLDQGRSFDPSFEFSAYSGIECLNYAALWVGAENVDGIERVSGAPLLEWRPTLDENDRVRERALGEPGTYRLYDDDGDGRVDEEILNDRDDDADGWIDEDLGLPASQVLAGDYTDDEPAAVNFVYPGAERHVPLGLTVHQEAYAWSAPEYRGVAGIRFEITNHGTGTLRNVYVGLLADLDSRRRDDRVGHLDDRVARYPVRTQFSEGDGVTVTVGGGDFLRRSSCFHELGTEIAVVTDGRADSGLPAVGLMGLDHTVDPLAMIPSAAAYARAPRDVSFRTTVMVNPARTATGVVPITDADRYAAMAGSFREADTNHKDDYLVLLSCGPFTTLRPGQTISFTAALLASSSVDSLIAAAGRLLYLHHGLWMNLQPDSLPESEDIQYHSGATGTFSHEICLEPPPGVSFVADPDCAYAYIVNPLETEPSVPPRKVLYRQGYCVWTDADCNPCTPPVSGAETLVRWLDPAAYLPPPNIRLTPGDHEITVAWDDLPEVLMGSGRLLEGDAVFRGYRLYKTAEWRRRIGELPPLNDWSLVGTFTVSPADTAYGEMSLASITDSTLDYAEILYEREHHPVGRYAYRDREVHNGFDYAYAVTVLYDVAAVDPLARTRASLESPLVVDSTQVSQPHAAARTSASQVWVVPNPFRGSAAWDRRPTLGDPLTRHIDFMGLPRARCTIKIWTLAGDFVAEIDHDGTSGDGEASWNLVSRNGQDIASGIYLFSVDSRLGHSMGRFVVIR